PTAVGLVARALAVGAALLWAAPLLGAIFGAGEGEGGDGGTVVEVVGVIVLSLANIAAVVVALRRARPGGWLLVGTGSCFVVFALATAGRNQLLAAAFSGGPFLLAGVLLLAATRPDRRRRRRRGSAGDPTQA
ncbi:MAG: hypothetical protein S0880_35765, partial [Actinomycetota bacterium]|nr:hypothetical protein [Actinomycetota bacterium]